jgi:hypothetical protein
MGMRREPGMLVPYLYRVHRISSFERSHAWDVITLVLRARLY